MLSRLCIFLISNIILSEVKCYYHVYSSVKFTPPKVFQDISSYFGYSIAYQAGSKRLLVGAPKADDEGKVFYCSIQNQECNQVNINIVSERNDPFDSSFYDIDFMLGVTVESGNNFSVACAPRISATRITYMNKNHLGTFGHCYVILDKSNIGLQMEKNKEDINKTTFVNIESLIDVSGWSLFVSNDGSILVGNPAFKESFLSYDNFTSSPTRILLNFNIQQGFGYSVIRGNFDGSTDLIAVSAPKGSSYNGTVSLLYKNQNGTLQVKTTIIGETLGSLFGACLCAADIDGDGLDELIVGAPLFAPHNSDEYDIGAFYVYKNTMDNIKFKLTKIKSIIGSKTGGYFGNAIIKVGDLNRDGGQDICVGAPYEDGGHGAVYLYPGSALRAEGNGRYIQRISSVSQMSFGFSLRTLTDYDGNGCNELAIGAPENNSVTLFHCFASIEVNLNPYYEDIQLLPINANNLKLSSCFDVVHPPKPVNIIATIRVTVRVIHMHARLANPNNGSTYQYLENITKDKNYCHQVNIHLDKEGDFSEQIQFSISAELMDNPMNMIEFNPNRVLLSPSSKLMATGAIPAERRCKGTCIPKLQLELFTPKNNTIASLKSEFVEVKVTSLGDPPSSPCVRLAVPDVAINTYPKDCIKINDQLICRPPAIKLNNGVVWQTGPIKLAMQELTSSNKVLNIIAKMYNKCDNLTDYTSKKALVHLDTDRRPVFVKSTSDHEEIRLTSVDLNNSTNVKVVNHIYTITNLGQTVWTNLMGQITIEPNLPKAFKILEEPLGIFEMETFALPKLERSNKIDVMVPIEINTKQLDGIINSKNLTLKTTLTVFLEGHTISNSSENLIYFRKNVQVPLWIILVAVLAGILLVTLLVLMLHKMGCFGRKNKKKLESLKNNIKRQSMRQSILIAARSRLRSADANVSTENIVVEQSDTQDNKYTDLAQENEPETKKDC